MGDTGSLFLGFSLAALTLSSEPERAGEPSLLSVIAPPLLVLSIPILDTTLVTLSRLLSGRPTSTGGKDHSSHRLVAIGLSEPRAVAVLWVLAAVAGVTGYFARSLDVSWSILLIVMTLLAMVVFTVYLGNVRIYDTTDPGALRSRGVTPLVVDFMHKRRVAEVFLDLVLVSLAYYAAYRLRFEGVQFQDHFQEFMSSLPVIIAAQLIAMFIVGAYRGVWRLFTLIDSVIFGKGVLLGTVSAVAIVFFVQGLPYSRTVFVIYAALLFLLVTGSRASFRLISEFASRRRIAGDRLVIYGAGVGGALAMREVTANSRVSYRMLGYIDDDASKRGARVHGYPVLGSFSKLEEIVNRGDVDTVLVSCRTLDPSRDAALKSLLTANRCRLIRLHVQLEEIDAPSGTLRFQPRR
jgi:UDP-GlcNAc:undecaprenyl-phosphate GlcNAc-1-phosphate transferase